MKRWIIIVYKYILILTYFLLLDDVFYVTNNIQLIVFLSLHPHLLDKYYNILCHRTLDFKCIIIILLYMQAAVGIKFA